MATCGSLQHIFDNNLLPENPTLLESLSWNQIKPVKSMELPSSFTEIFGELHFKESTPVPSSPSPSSSHVSTSSSTEINHTKLNQKEDCESSDTSQTPSSTSFPSTPITNHTNRHKSSDSFSWLSSESLQLCTEGLGFESSDEVEDLKSGMSECYWQSDQSEKEGSVKVEQYLTSSRYSNYGECRRSSRFSVGEYPPPISCIGRTGKPRVYFRSYRSDGRFVLKEIRIPTQEFLRAYREDGRLKLHFVHPDDDEFLEEEEDDDIESMVEEEENKGEDDDDCVIRHANEGKEIDGQVTSYSSIDERHKI